MLAKLFKKHTGYGFNNSINILLLKSHLNYITFFRFVQLAVINNYNAMVRTKKLLWLVKQANPKASVMRTLGLFLFLLHSTHKTIQNPPRASQKSIVSVCRWCAHPFTQINTKPWLHYSVKRKNIIPKLLILFRKCGIIDAETLVRKALGFAQSTLCVAASLTVSQNALASKHFCFIV